MGLTVLVKDFLVVLAPSASSVVAHGLPYTPQSVMPDRITAISVTSVDATNITFTNTSSTATSTANFRAYVWHTIFAGPDLGTQAWQAGVGIGVGSLMAGGIRQTVAQSIPQNVETPLTFDSTDFATPSSFADLTNNQLVIPEDGVYRTSMAAGFAGDLTAATYIRVQLLVNGTAVQTATMIVVDVTLPVRIGCVYDGSFSANDLITATVFQNGSAAADTDVSDSSGQAKLQAYKVPAV
jgi:hypothetical protein